jgi:hypothetical protein
MKLALKTTQKMLLLTTPTVASLAIAALPSQAATFASSEGFSIFNFSQSPVGAVTDAGTNTIASGGSVTAVAKVDAEVTDVPPIAFNSFLSTASGTGKNYFGLAQTFAAVNGQPSAVVNFLVGAGNSFSFNFLGGLNLATQIDTPSSESARATGSINFALFDTTDTANPVGLALFNLSGQLNTPGGGDFLTLQKTANISLDPDGTSITSAFGGLQEFGTAGFQGSFSSGSFDKDTLLTFVEIKKGEVRVKEVPEPSAAGGIALVALLLIHRQFRSKQRTAKLVLAADPAISIKA